MFTTATHTNITATYDDAAGTLSLAAAEGYGDSDARAAVSAAGDLTYNSSTGVITYTGPSAAEVRAHFSAGEGIDIASGVISGEDATATNKGIASFATANFTVSSGAVSAAAISAATVSAAAA